MSDRAVEIETVAARWSGRGRPDPARIARLTELALEHLVGGEGGPDRLNSDAESRLATRLAREVHRALGGEA